MHVYLQELVKPYLHELAVRMHARLACRRAVHMFLMSTRLSAPHLFIVLSLRFLYSLRATCIPDCLSVAMYTKDVLPRYSSL